ncbi:MAG: hypothetical protein WCJ49_04075, partial [Deltaproteobacteria bacterium]
FDGNHEETHLRVSKKIDGTPEGPSTIRNVYQFLQQKNLYSPLFDCAYRLFNQSSSREDSRDLIIRACQLDRRSREYVGVFSRLLYAVAPMVWYRRNRGVTSYWDIF